MADFMLWLIAGLALIIIEMMTGTFYLLVLGIAAFAGGLAAYLGGSSLWQVLCVGIVAVIGLFVVHRRNQSQRSGTQPDRSLDLGQAVTLESWVDQNAGRVRVKYRGTSWDAHLIGDSNIQLHETLYICGTNGNELQVSRTLSSKTI
jgi:membrane protein implicated in regulation of membrane protease activity